MLARQTNLSASQIRNWFANARRRKSLHLEESISKPKVKEKGSVKESSGHKTRTNGHMSTSIDEVILPIGRPIVIKPDENESGSATSSSDLLLSSASEVNTAQKSSDHVKGYDHGCGICKRLFTSLSNVTTHMRTHTGEKPYQCEYCDEALSNKSSYNRHVRRVHTGKKPYQCEHCDKAFSEKYSYNRHVRLVHTGKKPYSCSQCDKSFTKSGDLYIHTKSHTIMGEINVKQEEGSDQEMSQFSDCETRDDDDATSPEDDVVFPIVIKPDPDATSLAESLHSNSESETTDEWTQL